VLIPFENTVQSEISEFEQNPDASSIADKNQAMKKKDRQGGVQSHRLDNTKMAALDPRGKRAKMIDPGFAISHLGHLRRLRKVQEWGRRAEPPERLRDWRKFARTFMVIDQWTRT